MWVGNHAIWSHKAANKKKKEKKKSQKVSAGEMIGLQALKVNLEDKEHLKTHQKTHQSGKIKKKITPDWLI